MTTHLEIPNRKEVNELNDETTQRRGQVALIKETAESANDRRNFLLEALWAFRLAAALTTAHGRDARAPPDEEGGRGVAAPRAPNNPRSRPITRL